MSAGLQASALYEAGLTGTFVRQVLHRVPPIPPYINLHDKVAIVTGSSSGLGEECARQLLQIQLTHLILAVRSQSKGQAIASNLQAEFPKAHIEVWLLDMESYDSVREFAACCEKLDRLDVAILNAGCGKMRFTLCAGNHGREVTIQVNFLATVLLAILLIPIMKKNGVIGRKPGQSPQAPGRITIVTSDMSFWPKLDENAPSILDSVNSPQGFDGMMQYGKSKLLLVMFVSKLAEVVSPDDCIINLVNPSGVRGTGLMREAETILPRLFVWLTGFLLGRNLVNGTRQYLHSALVLGKESHGSFCDWKIRP
jgi:NAD(P)-dependent dehydrogenase (short-subunit alcohol dehydrogenase family)